MNKIANVKFEQITLPSDQDASGRTLGDEELEMLEAVIRSGTLTSTKGSAVKELESRFAGMFGVRHAFACASGTAAVHAAIAAVDPTPGDEIITTSITDMGAIAPIMYQGAIPVFADVDPITANVNAESIERVISERTCAIIVTHLFGNPVDMTGIMNLEAVRSGRVRVIEDSAQAFMATDQNRLVGTIGDIGCFSFQQGKHITAGEGGIVVTNHPIENDEYNITKRMRLFIDKAWGYGDPKPDHYFLALNYRMTELQGAVALAQLGKLEAGVAQRQAMAQRLDAALGGLPGIVTPPVAEGTTHAYWRYCLSVDLERIPGGPTALGEGLKEYNIASAPRYIQKPAFKCAVIRDQKTFGRRVEGRPGYPFSLIGETADGQQIEDAAERERRMGLLDYSEDKYPGTFEALDRILVLPWNEKYEESHVDYLAHAIRAQHDAIVKN